MNLVQRTIILLDLKWEEILNVSLLLFIILTIRKMSLGVYNYRWCAFYFPTEQQHKNDEKITNKFSVSHSSQNGIIMNQRMQRPKWKDEYFVPAPKIISRTETGDAFWLELRIKSNQMMVRKKKKTNIMFHLNISDTLYCCLFTSNLPNIMNNLSFVSHYEQFFLFRSVYLPFCWPLSALWNLSKIGLPFYWLSFHSGFQCSSKNCDRKRKTQVWKEHRNDLLFFSRRKFNEFILLYGSIQFDHWTSRQS